MRCARLARYTLRRAHIVAALLGRLATLPEAVVRSLASCLDAGDDEVGEPSTLQTPQPCHMLVCSEVGSLALRELQLRPASPEAAVRGVPVLPHACSCGAESESCAKWQSAAQSYALPARQCGKL